MADNLSSKLKSLISRIDGRCAIAIKDFFTDSVFFYNEKDKFHAASIIKVPILIELFRHCEKNCLSLDKTLILQANNIVDGAGVLQELHTGLKLTLNDLARLTIVVSDNTASNMLIDLLGFEAINNFIESVGLTGTRLNKTFMTPLKSPEMYNYTNAADMLTLLENLYKGKLLSKKFTNEVLSIMSRQQYREKIPKYLPENLTISNKTGEVSGVRHDIAIISDKNLAYGIAVLTSELKNEYIGDEFIAKVSLEVYKVLSNKKKHNKKVMPVFAPMFFL